MDATQFIAGVLTNNGGLIHRALEGLSNEDLLKQPNEQSNPIGWLVWHQTRTEDRIISLLSGKPQAWIEGGWHAKFGMGADPKNGGIGHTMKEVTALRPTLDALKGYAAAAREKTLAYLGGLNSSDLDREVRSPVDNSPRKLGEYLGILVSDYLHHCGQVCYLCGYLKGWGWFPM